MSFFSMVDHEVFAITAWSGDERSAFIATWVLPASIQPGYPECLILSSPLNYSHELLCRSGRFVLHLLSQEQAWLVPQLGLASGRSSDKLKDVPLQKTSEGDLVLANTCGYAICTIKEQFALAERVAIVGKVREQKVFTDRLPLTKKKAFASLDEKTRQQLLAKQQDVAKNSLNLRKSSEKP